MQPLGPHCGQQPSLPLQVVDLGDFLKKMGATISGLGTKRIVIQGKKKLNGCNYTVMPDRIEE